MGATVVRTSVEENIVKGRSKMELYINGCARFKIFKIKRTICILQYLHVSEMLI